MSEDNSTGGKLVGVIIPGLRPGQDSPEPKDTESRYCPVNPRIDSIGYATPSRTVCIRCP